MHPFDLVTVIQNIFAIGINHHASDAASRSSFSLDDDQKEILLKKSLNYGLHSLAVLSTCNRTEVYGYGKTEDAEKIYLDIIGADADKVPLIRKAGREAIQHIFKVAAGLDSQVIGDLEILGQFKQAFIKAKERQMLNNVAERLVNSSLQAAKEVRSQTRISSGTVSLSYAATKFVKDRFEGRNCNILIVGAGKFGSRVAKNLHDYFPQATRTVCNRTRERAAAIVAAYGGTAVGFENLSEAISNADVVISCVNDAGSFVLKTNTVRTIGKAQLFIDMSIPLSIDPELAKRPGIQIVTLDEIGKVVNDTLETRKEDIPVAEQIIERHIDEFCAWADMFGRSDSIREWKQTLEEKAATCPYLSQLEERHRDKLISKSVATFATYIRRNAELPVNTKEILDRFIEEGKDALACQNKHAQSAPDPASCPWPRK